MPDYHCAYKLMEVPPCLPSTAVLFLSTLPVYQGHCAHYPACMCMCMYLHSMLAVHVYLHKCWIFSIIMFYSTCVLPPIPPQLLRAYGSDCPRYQELRDADKRSATYVRTEEANKVGY